MHTRVNWSSERWTDIDRLAVAVGCRPDAVVHISDLQPMLQLMQQNILLNGLQGKVVASVYEWGENNRPANVPAQPSVLLGADLVYFEPAFPLLLQTLAELIGPDTTCYFCFKRRRRADMGFLKAAKKAFLVQDIDDDPFAQDYARENIFLYVVSPDRSLLSSHGPPLLADTAGCVDAPSGGRLIGDE